MSWILLELTKAQMERRDLCNKYCATSGPIEYSRKSIPVSKLNVKFSHEGTRPKFWNHLHNVLHFDVPEILEFGINSIIDTVIFGRGQVYMKVLHCWFIKKTHCTAQCDLVSWICVDHPGMLGSLQFISSCWFQSYMCITAKSKAFLNTLKDNVLLCPVRIVSQFSFK